LLNVANIICLYNSCFTIGMPAVCRRRTAANCWWCATQKRPHFQIGWLAEGVPP